MSPSPSPDALCPCGADCTECEKYPGQCPGCHEIQGKVWWAAYTGQPVCPFYACCVQDKRLADCGLCPAFPCQHFSTGDPTLSDEENAAIHQKQLARLTRPAKP